MRTERFVPEDERLANCYEQGLEHGLPLGSDRAAVRLRLAKHEIGEPPLYDLRKDIGSIVSARNIERSECVPGHRSGEPIIFDNQKLWGLQGEELRTALEELFS